MARKKIAIIGASSILLVAMVAAIAISISKKNGGGGDSSGNSDVTTTSKSVEQICQPTDYKQTCVQTLSSAGGNTTDPKELIKVAFTSAVRQISEAIQNSTLMKNAVKDPRINSALDSCHELLNHSIGDLQKSFDKVGTFDISKINDYTNDLKTWLSGAITYQQTCLDGFVNTTGTTGDEMKKVLKLSGELTSNGLAIVTELSKILSSYNFASSSQRRLLSTDLPTWITSRQRQLLAATPATVKPNVVVAKDGSGKYKTIEEALKDVPLKSNNTFVIYIKAGVYSEYISIPKSMSGVFLLGDGPTKTKITGSKSFVGGFNTYKTPTVSADGDHFMAKDIGFENTAGADNHQAVALRVSGDRSVLYNCQFDGYQDTLYAHAHRQFYRDCTITGTVDFIFGDAAAVFQNCRMIIRKPLDQQQCMVTAHGRKDKRATTGFVLQNCVITAAPEMAAVQTDFKAFLGRPWHPFSRVIVMQSQIDSIIDPAGWAPWTGTVGLDTCWYAEYNNRGPGANTANRVTWQGIQKPTQEVAESFTAAQFIDGDTWIPATGAPYIAGMV